MDSDTSIGREKFDFPANADPDGPASCSTGSGKGDCETRVDPSWAALLGWKAGETHPPSVLAT